MQKGSLERTFEACTTSVTGTLPRSQRFIPQGEIIWMTLIHVDKQLVAFRRVWLGIRMPML